MAVHERKRLAVLGVILGLVLAGFVAKTFLVKDNSNSSRSSAQPTNPFVPHLNGSSTTSPIAPGTPAGSGKPTTSASTTPKTVPVYANKNPFEPVIQAVPDRSSTTSGPSTTTPTTTSGPTTTTTSSVTTSTTSSSHPSTGQVVRLIDVYRTPGGKTNAQIRVGASVYRVGVHSVFGKGNAFRVVSLDLTRKFGCGQFLFGDSVFRLCEGQQITK